MLPPRRFLSSRRTVAGLVAAVLAAGLVGAKPVPAQAAQPRISVWVDGQRLWVDVDPVMIQNRVLVPMRSIFSALGAQVDWDGSTRTVTAILGDRYVRIQIDNPQACLSPGCNPAVELDVAPRILSNRTFVPIRFVATALGAQVEWDGARQAVIIRSGGAEPLPVQPPPSMATGLKLLTVAPGQAIAGVTELRSRLEVGGAARIQYILVDPVTGKGPVIAAGKEPEAAYTWRPDPAYSGPRILVAAAYDAQGRKVAEARVPVEVAVDSTVTVRGIAPGQVLQGTGGSVTMTAEFGFVATRATWSLVDPTSGREYPIADADPYAPFTWWPGVWSNGNWLLRVTVYDRLGNAYRSEGIPIAVKMQPRTAIGGIQPGQTLTGPVSLRAQVNYSASRIQFRLGNGTVLGESTDPAAAIRWFPSPDQNGPQTVRLTVWDTQGNPREAEPVQVEVRVQPTLRLLGVGPRQVVTEPVPLRVEANVPLTGVSFRIARPGSGQWTTVAGGADPKASYTWNPATVAEGDWQIQAVATTASGQTLASEAVTFRVYKGPIYGPRPAAPKDQFIDLITPWAVATHRETGMSAALQVAQAILETGWGQYVPVDKYTGQFSYNLFGIKGQGPAGSVISNTWEEYNGVAYRVDDYFRAYRSLEESWQDHQWFLLDPSKERYAPFRAVMADPIQGAWALRRTGYATDSQYALKLIDIMNRYNLYRLDEVEP
ncbi:MAG: glucosaminidase domain-containing protein [Firmicutes bacterium]|nr:glucosaminidase domain-containing protein [Bacillota bacterium]